MATTLYGTFADIENAERAVGAMMDYGVKQEDISLVKNHQGEATVTDASGRTVWTKSEGMSNAAYGDAPAAGGDRFGADATGVTDTGVRRAPDTQGLASESEMRNPNYAPGSSRVSDSDYDNLAARDENRGDDRDRDDDYDPEKGAKSGLTATTGEDAGAGALKGAGIGLGVGALAAVVSVFVPGLGFFVGGGALATALAGLAGTTGAGAIAGAVTGYLKDQGMDSHLAEHYGSEIEKGGALVSVHVPSDTVDESTVRSIFDKYGATHVTNYAGTGSGGYVA